MSCFGIGSVSRSVGEAVLGTITVLSEHNRSDYAPNHSLEQCHTVLYTSMRCSESGCRINWKLSLFCPYINFGYSLSTMAHDGTE